MPDNTSFLPEDYLQRKIARRTNVICLSLFAVEVVGILAAFFIGGLQSNETRDMHQRVSAQYEEAARRIEQLEQLQSRKHEMIRKAKIAAVLVERVPRSFVLAELINHMPPSLSLMEFELETKTLRTAPRPVTALERQRQLMDKQKKEQEDPLPDVLPTQCTIGMVGVAANDVDISTYIGKLNQHPMFSSVGLEFVENARLDDRTVRKFRIELEMNPDVDLASIEPTKVARSLHQNPMSNRFQIDEQGNLVAPEIPDGQLGAVDPD